MSDKRAAVLAAATTNTSRDHDNTTDGPWQLLGLRHSRSLRIALKLGRFSDLEEYAHDMRRCSTRVLYGASPGVDKPIIEAIYHCRRAACQVCRGERQEMWQRRIGEMVAPDMRYTLDGNGDLYGDTRILRWRHRIERLEHRLAHARDEEHRADIQRALTRLYQRLDRARRPEERTLYPYLITLTVQNPEHVWNGPKDFSLLWERDAESPEDRLRARVAALDREIAAQEALIAARRYHRGIRALRQGLRDLREQRRAVLAELDIARQPNQLDALLWHPWRRAREYARLHPDSEWGRTWSHVRGGLWVTEVTFNARARTFHPHIHMLVLADVPYLANQRDDNDANVWSALLQPFFTRPMNVHINRIPPEQWQRDPQAVVREVTKYLTKPEKDERGKTVRSSGIPDWAYREIVLAQAGRRLINTFGVFRMPEPAWDPNGGDAPTGPLTVGMHYMREWRRLARQYEVVAAFPASPEFPIIGAGQRLAGDADLGRYLVRAARAAVRPQIVDIGGQPYAADGIPEYDSEAIHMAKIRLLARTDPAGAELAGIPWRIIAAALRQR
jgi:hypothetical protein